MHDTWLFICIDNIYQTCYEESVDTRAWTQTTNMYNFCHHNQDTYNATENVPFVGDLITLSNMHNAHSGVLEF